MLTSRSVLKNIMQQKRVYRILVLGALVVLGAWSVRHQVQQRRRIHPAPVQAPDSQAVEQELIRLHKAVQAAPTDPAARWALFEFYNRYGLLDKAGEQLVALLKIDPKDKRVHLELANALLAKGDYALAEASYRDVIDMDPKSLAAWQGLSATMIKERRFLEANTVGQYALALSPRDPNTHLLLATSALEYADQFPDPAGHAGELEFARKELEFLKTVLPDNADIYFALGRCYRGLHNAPAAISNLELAHKLQPDRQDVGQLLAVSYRANNQRPAAIKLLEELTSHLGGHPCSRAYVRSSRPTLSGQHPTRRLSKSAAGLQKGGQTDAESSRLPAGSGLCLLSRRQYAGGPDDL